MHRNYSWIWLTLAVIVIDRITKILVLHYLPYAQPVAVFHFFNLFFVYNTGAAFSFLGNGGGWQNWLFGVIALLVSCLLIIKLWWYTPAKEVWLQVALALILGGALGNFYDRLAYHHVIDFLDFYVRSWHFPSFNIADSAICIGALLLIKLSIKNPQRNIPKRHRN